MPKLSFFYPIHCYGSWHSQHDYHALAKRLTDKFHIQFHVADDPLHSVAKGTCLALKNTDNFSFLIRN